MGKNLLKLWIAILSLSAFSSAWAAKSVTDTIAPEITLNGSNVTIEAGNYYTDAGVTSSDNTSGEITVSTLSAVDITKAGLYTVTYIAEDAAGNRAKAIRRVEVVDNIAPEVHLNGDSNITIEAGSHYSDAGVTSTDNSSGAITVVTTIAIDTLTSGEYKVTYTATDSSGNQASIHRKVMVTETDHIAPVITLNGNNPVTITSGISYSDAGAIAIDDKDGEVQVTMDLSRLDINQPGIYEVNYEASDGAGNSLSTSRTVIVEALPILDLVPDPVDPVSNSVPDLAELIGQWGMDEKGDIIASDTSGNNNHLTINRLSERSHVDGKLGGALNFDGIKKQDASIDYATPILKPKSVTLSAWIKPDQNDLEWEWIAAQGDNYGLFIEPDSRRLAFYKKEEKFWTGIKSPEKTIHFNKWQHVLGTFNATTRTVKIYIDGVEVGSDVVSPEIVYSEGDGFTIGSMQGDRYFNGSIDDVRVYNTSFSQTEISDLMARANVDTQPPAISIKGSDAVSVILGTSYNDAGAVAIDLVDGEVVVSVDANSVDTSTLGTYTVSYVATDGAGNTAKATRTVQVIVVDTTAPVITLLGLNPVTLSVDSSYRDKGATAIDDVDGKVTVEIDSSQVNSSIAGTYEVTFTATDSANNQKVETRSVIISQNPIIDKTVFIGTYDGYDQPEEGRRGSIEFNDYSDPKDPGATADWLADSTGQIHTVYDNASFTAALRAAQPGDRIQLLSGIYQMQDIILSGLQGNPITIESAPGQWAIFDGAVAGSDSQLDVRGAWLNFRNFEIRKGRLGSIYIVKSHHILFEGLKIHNNDRGFDLTDGSHHCLIRFNESYHNFSKSNHGQDGDGFGVWSEGPYNDAIGAGVILEYNIAWGNADDGIDMWMNESTVTIRNNIVRNNGFNVLNDPAYVGNGNGFKLGPLGTGHIVIGNIADTNPASGFDYNGGTDSHYVKGNISTNNSVLDYDLPNLTVFEDNYKTGGVLAQ